MAFYITITHSGENRRTVIGAYLKREEAVAALTEIASHQNLGRIDRIEITPDE
ncbi:hypothetical protein D3C86_2039510 [compost metagenome]